MSYGSGFYDFGLYDIGTAGGGGNYDVGPYDFGAYDGILVIGSVTGRSQFIVYVPALGAVIVPENNNYMQV